MIDVYCDGVAIHGVQFQRCYDVRLAVNRLRVRTSAMLLPGNLGSLFTHT